MLTACVWNPITILWLFLDSLIVTFLFVILSFVLLSPHFLLVSATRWFLREIEVTKPIQLVGPLQRFNHHGETTSQTRVSCYFLPTVVYTPITLCWAVRLDKDLCFEMLNAFCQTRVFHKSKNFNYARALYEYVSFVCLGGFQAFGIQRDSVNNLIGIVKGNLKRLLADWVWRHHDP